MKLKLNLLILLIGLNIGLAFASSPDVVLKEVGNRMISELKSNKTALKGPSGGKIIDNIVNHVLVPYVDVSRMSAAVVGRQYWLSASANQRNIFMGEFKRLVISTYAAALSAYDDDRLEFSPKRGAGASSQVNSEIIRRSGQRIPVSYNVESSGGSWKIYDFSIENVSMVQSYRSQFASVLSSGGLNGLITRLQEHNKSTGR